jgi:NitT/TauT family transport system substrate-binding protein
MSLSRTSFVRLGAAAAAGAFLRPAAASANAPLTIAAIPSDVAAEAYYARELGLFKKAAMDVAILPLTNGGAIAAAVASGSAQVGFSNVISLAIAHQRGLPFTVLAPANLHVASAPTTGMLAVKRSSPIRTARDLTGKIVAVTGLNNIAHVAARLWIDKNGGDSTAVRWIELPFSEMRPAILSGRVDCASIDAINDPEFGKPGDPLRQIASTFDAISPRFAPSVWFSTSAWVAEHRPEAKAIVEILHQTATWANAHHRESAQILTGFSHQTVAAIESSTRTTYGERMSADLIQPDIDVAARYGLIARPFPASEIISSLA